MIVIEVVERKTGVVIDTVPVGNNDPDQVEAGMKINMAPEFYTRRKDTTDGR